MRLTFPFACLLLGLALSPASCSPLPDHHNAARESHTSRSTTESTTGSKIPGWEIAVVIICLIVGLILIGFTGGALETLLNMKSKRPAPREPDDPDFATSRDGPTTPDGQAPEINVTDEKGIEDDASFEHEEIAPGESGHGRYSWQDRQGVMTEVYEDGTLPDAGPAPPQHGGTGVAQGYGVVTNEGHGYPVQAAMRGFEGVHYQGEAGSVESHPPFAVHDEYDDAEYGHATDVVSPMTPEAHAPAWPRPAASAGQTGGHYDDVEI